ncbi:MAG: flippase-like domain-containing protein [Lachnospiraceae bacterium]|nr:flippase-like domain-containing protein [Lachnospiraceae bacterium]
MQGKKKNITHIVFLFFLVAVTFFVILKDQNMDEIYEVLRHADMLFVLPAVIFGTSRIYGEALGIHMIMRSFHKPVSFGKCIGYAGVGFLFSGITPSASGGQPAQLFYMTRDQNPIAASGLCLVLLTIVSRATMLLFGVAAFILYRLDLYRSLGKVKLLFVLGFSINAFLCIAFMFVLFSGKIAGKILTAAVELFAGWHLVKNKEELLTKLMVILNQYEEGAAYIKGHGGLLLRLLLLSIVQRTLMYLVPYFIYLSFGLNGEASANIMMLQSVVAICSDMLPLPGGVFANEKCYMIIMEPVFQAVHVLPSLLLSRGISFYFMLVLSACIVLFWEIRTAIEHGSAVQH